MQEGGNRSQIKLPFFEKTVHLDPIEQQTWKKAVVSVGMAAHFAPAAPEPNGQHIPCLKA